MKKEYRILSDGEKYRIERRRVIKNFLLKILFGRWSICGEHEMYQGEIYYKSLEFSTLGSAKEKIKEMKQGSKPFTIYVE